MNILDVARPDKRVEESAERYFRRYRPQIEALESSSTLSKVRSVTPYDIYALGKQLETFDVYKKICEADGALGQLGTIPNIALDVISASYGTSPLSVIASTQPIEEEQGIVYFKSIIAQSTRGNVKEGDTIYSSNQIEDTAPIGYSSNRLYETINTVADTTEYKLTLPGLPIRPGFLKFTTNLPNVIINDNGDGNIIGKGAEGTIDYNTGALVLKLATAPEAGRIITVQYDVDHSSSTEIPKIISKYVTKPVSARIFAIKDTVGLDTSYALRKRLGVIADDQQAEDLVTAINSETMNTAVVTLVSSAIGVTEWKKTAPEGVSYFEHKQTLKDAIVAAEASILGNAGRGGVNILIAGRNAAAILSTLPGFTRLTDGSANGPHIFGTLDGATVVRVPNSNVLNADKILAMYKGTSPFDAPIVYAPYMPLLVTTALPDGRNPLLTQKAAAVWAAIENLVPAFVTTINLV